MPIANSKTSNVLGFALLAAAALAGAWWLMRQGDGELLNSRNAGAPSQAIPEPGPSTSPDLAPEGLVRDPVVGSVSGNVREDAPDTGSDTGMLTLAAVDAITGDPIPLFWARRSGAGEIARPTERFRTTSGETRLQIRIDDPPALLTVLGANYAPKEIRADGTKFLRVELDRATAIVGTVRDGASAVLPSARVTLERQVLDPETSAVTWGPPGGNSLRRTDERGRYAFDRLTPGTYRTNALAGTVHHTSDGQTVTAGAWTTIDHWLAEDGSLHVELVRPDGLPSVKSRIMLGNGEARNGEPILARYTDENGRAMLGPLEAGTYELTVLSDHGTLQPVAITHPLAGAARGGLRLKLLPLPQDD